MVLSYKTLKTQAESQITEKKSRFIATAAPVPTQDEAWLFIERIKKKYKDAAHNCAAYRVGADALFERRSDDGEPSGTAGAPILETLRKANVTDAVVVVTRYFGGILLGAASLSRVYAASAAGGLRAAGVVEKRLMQNMSVTVDYGLSGKLGGEIVNRAFLLKDTVYGENVTFYVAHAPDSAALAEDFYTRVSAGKAVIKRLSIEYIVI